jgi:tRNA 2-thiocytidine biosynthesis protein TtcA
MIRDWQKKFPGRIENMFAALQNVVPSHLMDTELHDFKNLKITGMPTEDGDKAFDEESFEAPNVMASCKVCRWFNFESPFEISG